MRGGGTGGVDGVLALEHDDILFRREGRFTMGKLPAAECRSLLPAGSCARLLGSCPMVSAMSSFLTQPRGLVLGQIQAAAASDLARPANYGSGQSTHFDISAGYPRTDQLSRSSEA